MLDPSTERQPGVELPRGALIERLPDFERKLAHYGAIGYPRQTQTSESPMLVC